MSRIVIGVTGPAHGIPWAWWATRFQLRRNDVSPRRLHANTPRPDETFAGFVIGGGNDVDPAIYGGDMSAGRSVDAVRDEYELAVLAFARRHAIPVLGICRGAQLINVHAGGSLVGDLGQHRVHTSNRGTLLPRKIVSVDPESRLADWLGRDRTRVNSLHHQAVERVGRGLVVTATDRDDIVQGIESRGDWLRVGVQWHPEYMPQRADQRRLVSAFVTACREAWTARA